MKTTLFAAIALFLTTSAAFGGSDSILAIDHRYDPLNPLPNLAVADRQFVPIRFDGDDELVDTFDLRSASSPTRIAIKADGVYRIQAQAEFAYVNNEGRRFLLLVVNGDLSTLRLLGQQNVPSAVGSTAVGGLPAVLALSDGDYFEVMAYQDSGAPATLLNWSVIVSRVD